MTAGSSIERNKHKARSLFMVVTFFRGDHTMVEFIRFDNEDNSSKIFEALSNGSIDVAAGIGITLERDVREPTTGEGFSFSAPYFYDPPQGP